MEYSIIYKFYLKKWIIYGLKPVILTSKNKALYSLLQKNAHIFLGEKLSTVFAVFSLLTTQILVTV